jgi:RND family efflux transporter MFP subunit
MKEGKFRRKRWWIIATMILVILLVGVIYWIIRPREPHVKTAVVNRQTLENKIFATGNVRPVAKQIIMPTQFTAPIDQVHVKVNQPVKAGDVLLTLQNSAQTAALQSAKQAVQQAQTALQQAQQEQAAAPVGFQPQFSGTIAAAQTSLAQAQTGLAQAQAAYDATIILAKMNGTVVLVNSEGVGSDGSPAPVVEVVGTTKMIVTTVSEVDAVHIQSGMSATVSTESYPDKTWDAKVSTVAEFASTGTSGTGQVEVDLTVDSHFPVPLGYSVDVHIVTSMHQETPVVPYAALTQNGGSVYSVYVLSHGRVHKVDVTLGITTDNLVEVTKGVQPNDIVVLNPPATLQDNQAVIGS